MFRKVRHCFKSHDSNLRTFHHLHSQFSSELSKDAYEESNEVSSLVYCQSVINLSSLVGKSGKAAGPAEFEAKSGLRRGQVQVFSSQKLKKDNQCSSGGSFRHTNGSHGDNARTKAARRRHRSHRLSIDDQDAYIACYYFQGEEETVLHLLCDSPKYTQLRRNLLKWYEVQKLSPWSLKQ